MVWVFFVFVVVVVLLVFFKCCKLPSVFCFAGCDADGLGIPCK